MANSLARTIRQTQSQTLCSTLPTDKPKAAKLSLPLPSEQIEANGDVVGTPLAALVDETNIRMDYKDETFARNAGVSCPTYSQAKNNRNGKNFNSAWIDRQPIEWKACFWRLYGLKHGFSAETNIEIALRNTERHLALIHDWLRLVRVDVR
jgi:hypothetical protein